MAVTASRGGDGDDDVDERSPSDDDEGIATSDDVRVSRKKKEKSEKNEKFALPRAPPDLSRGGEGRDRNARNGPPPRLDGVRLSPLRQVRKVRTQRYTRGDIPRRGSLRTRPPPAKTIHSRAT